MNYQKQTWIDGPEGGTPLSAIRMGHIEDGIEDAHEQAELSGGQVFNLAKANTIFGLSVLPTQQTVIQCPWIDPVTRNVYTSQATTGTVAGEREHAIITKYTPGGVQIATMTLFDAGHATTFFTETVGGVTYVVVNWIAYATGSAGSAYTHNLVRFPWADNVTRTWAEVSATKVNTFVVPTQYVTAALDSQKDIALMRETRSGGLEAFYLRKWSEMKAGVDNKLTGEIITGSPTEVVQGWATDGTTQMFRWMGSGTGYPTYQDLTLMSYSWATLTKTGERNVNGLRYEADGTEEDGWSEAEGMTTYRDPVGRLHLILGVSTGVSGRRRHKLHSATMAETTPFEHGGNLVRRWASGWETDLTARIPDPAATTLQAACTKPGWYYLSSADLADMTDKPADIVPGAAYLLEVSGRNPARTAWVQRLYRLSVSDNATGHYYRTATTTGSGEWYRVAERKRPFASLARVANQGIPNATWTPVIFDAWAENPPAGTPAGLIHGGSWAAGPGELTLPAGRYVMAAQVHHANIAAPAGQRVARALLDGVVLCESEQQVPHATYGSRCQLSKIFTATEGQKLKVEAYQSQGAGSTVNVGGGSHMTYLTVEGEPL